MTENPRIIAGIGVGSRGVVAPVATVSPPPAVPADEPAPDDVAAAQGALTDALAAVREDLLARADAAAEPTLGEVLAAAAQMAGDPALAQRAGALIADGSGPATAIDAAVEEFAATFEAIGGPMAERVTDLRSVRDRVVARLTGQSEPGVELREPSVVVARDLSPADTSALDLALVVGIVTEEGGPTSHTAIIAGQLGLPCVVRAEGATGLADGTIVAVDSASGRVVVSPDEATVAALERRGEALAALAEDTADGATADGHGVDLLVNIGTVADAERSAQVPSQGVGLFRTEVLFLEATTAPTVEEQAEAYERVLRAFAGRKVVVRTLDAGADKPLAFAQQDGEENPALGVRGYRLVRTLPDLLADQLAALALAKERAGEDGATLWVMAPMVSTPAEAADFAAAARSAGLATPGVMVEVPAAALRADRVLAEVDFVSLGTNDLAQYTMASDRLLGSLADLLDRWQPAVLELVARTAAAGTAAGRPVGVCGESAGDPLMALVLTGMGVTSLSMSDGSLPEVRFALRSHTLDTCEQMAAAALAAPDGGSARAAVIELLDDEAKAVLAAE
ncbi:Phosphoenolpyruvate-protein phosphotransferase of PTS system [Actinomycetales bacterium JB111]|nr:Phosphoenolpyruvate-protein phosphotransferase of PTS system [Actinomycetales bacterium JB111]